MFRVILSLTGGSYQAPFVANHPNRKQYRVRLTGREIDLLLDLLYRVIEHQVKGGYRNAAHFERIADKLVKADELSDTGA
jgi:hypothetical protein